MSVGVTGGVNNEFSGHADGNVNQFRDLYLSNGRTLPTPRQFMPPAVFVNRVRERGLIADAPTTVIYGPPGIGKTSLAQAALYHLEGPLLHVALGRNEPEAVLQDLLIAFGITGWNMPRTLAGKSGLFRTLVHEQPVRMVLDDAVTSAQVEPLLPGSSASRVVITSHRPLGTLRALAIELTAFDDEAAYELLGVRNSKLIAVCERVPLALDVLGCALRNGMSERRAERKLSDGGAVHKLMSQEGKAVIDVSYQDLTPPAARLYRLLALHPGADFDGELAEAIDPHGEDLLDELEDRGLLRAAHGDRYSFNSLARGHALQQLDRNDSAEEQLAALQSIVWWHVDRAIAADKVISEHRWRLSDRYADVDRFDGTDLEAMDWLEPDRANFVQVASAAYESEMDDAVLALAEALWGLHFHRKLYSDWQVVNEVGIKAAIRRGDRRAQARMRCQLGFRHYELDDFAAAKREFAAAVEVEPADHRQGMATDLESLALAHYGLGEFEDALDCVDRAVPLATQPQQVALLGHHRARFLSALGRHEEALAGLMTALEFFRSNGNRYNEARVLTSVGEAYLRAGEPAKALPALERALTIMSDLHRLLQQALVRGVLSQAHQTLGDLDAARDQASRAHAILHVLEHPREAAARQRLDELS